MFALPLVAHTPQSLFPNLPPAFGVEAMTEEFKAAGDDYSHIMAEALADRLAEVRACATAQHGV